jgi:tetratricopeptide (TPR) repeat protein
MTMRNAVLILGAAAALFLEASQSLVKAESSHDQLLISAHQSLISGENQRAIDQYSQVLQSSDLRSEARAAALTNRGLAAQRLKQHEQAIEDYTAALNTDALITSEKAVALYNRGLSHHLLKQLPLAIEDYTNAIFFVPDMPQAYMSRGNALRESGQYLFALSDYERALRYKHPDKARVHYASALTYMALRRLPDAERELVAAVKANPGHKHAQSRLDELRQLTASAPVISPAGVENGAGAMGSTVLNKPDNAPAVVPPEALLEQKTGTATPAQVPGAVSSEEKVPDRLPSQQAEAEPVAVQTASAADAQSSAQQPGSIDQLLQETSNATPAAPVEADTNIQTASTSAASDGSTSADIAPAAEIPAEANSGWSVQLGSATSEDGARATWAKMQKKIAILRSVETAVMRADLGTKGVVYRIRQNGFADAAEARAACKKYKKSGADCFVSQNGG